MQHFYSTQFFSAQWSLRASVSHQCVVFTLVVCFPWCRWWVRLVWARRSLRTSCRVWDQHWLAQYQYPGNATWCLDLLTGTYSCTHKIVVMHCNWFLLDSSMHKRICVTAVDWNTQHGVSCDVMLECICLVSTSRQWSALIRTCPPGSEPCFQAPTCTPSSDYFNPHHQLPV